MIVEVVVVVKVVVYFPDIYVSPGFFVRQKLVLLLTRNPKFIIIVVVTKLYRLSNSCFFSLRHYKKWQRIGTERLPALHKREK